MGEGCLGGSQRAALGPGRCCYAGNLFGSRFRGAHTNAAENIVAKPEGAVATIRCGEVAIDLYAGIEPSFIVSLCKELQYAK